MPAADRRNASPPIARATANRGARLGSRKKGRILGQVWWRECGAAYHVALLSPARQWLP